MADEDEVEIEALLANDPGGLCPYVNVLSDRACVAFRQVYERALKAEGAEVPFKMSKIWEGEDPRGEERRDKTAPNGSS